MPAAALLLGDLSLGDLRVVVVDRLSGGARFVDVRLTGSTFEGCRYALYAAQTGRLTASGPLNRLPYEELCPGRDALLALQKRFR